MPDPTTSVLDDYNRSNTGPPLGGNWSVITAITAAGFKIISNYAQPGGDSSACYEYWNAATFGPDSEVFYDLPAIDAASDYVGVALMLGVANPTLASITGYEIDFVIRDTGSPVNSVLVSRIDNSTTIVQLGAAASYTIVAGDTLWAKKVGSTISVYAKHAAGSYSLIMERTDANYSTGRIGKGWWYNIAANTHIDNYGGGTVVTGGGSLPIPVAMANYRQRRR